MPQVASSSVILRELRYLPSNKHQEVLDFIQFLRSRAAVTPSPVRKSLQGIWKDKGFERLGDIEQAVQDARAELGASILKRIF